MLRITSITSLCLVSMAAIAQAQGADPAAPPPPADPAAPPTDPAAPVPVDAAALPPGDGTAAPIGTAQTQPPPPPPSGGLRNGFSLSVGQEFGTSEIGGMPGNEFSGQLYGVDWRIGWQINKALGIYAHSHLSLGTIKINQSDNITGNFASAVVAEYALPFGLFFGGGAGYGVLNNPSGPLVQARVGFYPFGLTSEGGKSRHLNVALDSRLYFVSAGAESLTMKHIALSIGYDRF